jgi:hypothetical protein
LTEDKPVFLRRKALRKPGNQERKFDLAVTFGSAIAIFFFLVSWLSNLLIMDAARTERLSNSRAVSRRS